MRFHSTLSSVCALVAAAGLGQAQQVSGPKAELMQQPPGAIKILAVEGEGAINSIRAKRATPPVVEVRDDKDKPVAGAEVVFLLPAVGPGGSFHGWMRNQTARTDSNGRATASGYAPNDEEGRFNIKVTATSGAKTATLIIGQSNARGTAGGAQARSSRKGLWTTLAIVGAGGLIGGVVAASRNGATPTAAVTIPVTITAGPITVGGPR